MVALNDVIAPLDLYGNRPYIAPRRITTMAQAAARLEARISPELSTLLKRAAELQGRSVTDFVVSAVSDAAQRAVADGDLVRLSLADQERFAKALLAPAAPTAAMKRAFARRRRLVAQD